MTSLGKFRLLIVKIRKTIEKYPFHVLTIAIMKQFEKLTEHSSKVEIYIYGLDFLLQNYKFALITYTRLTCV